MVEKLSVNLPIARLRRYDGKPQYLEDHLNNVGNYSEIFTLEIGLNKVGRILGLLHDFGKASNEFINYVYSDDKSKKGKVDHRTAGAQYLKKITHSNKIDSEKKLAIELLELVIISHHGGLIDCICDSDNKLKIELNKSFEKTHLNEAESIIDKELLNLVNTLITEAVDSLEEHICCIFKNVSEKVGMFRVGLLARFLLSCLVDADHTDARRFEFPFNNKYENLTDRVSWCELSNRFYAKLSTFDNKTDINSLRVHISRQCSIAANRPRGAYTLTAPTGGGKTLSSFRFALEHRELHKMKRIIYILPYTSIIDQNASELRKILEFQEEEGTIVLEHHSNLNPEIHMEVIEGPWKISSENWDSPIIFTTLVHFLNSIYSNNIHDIVRMHRLANSVIIFDEVQNLPLKTIYLFNEIVNFLVYHCESTILFCTATQPLLSRKFLKHPVILSDNSEIMHDITKFSKKIMRTEIILKMDTVGIDVEEISAIVQSEIKMNSSILIIVNTKSKAKELFQNLRYHLDDDINMIHLSANMCPVHRMKKIDSMKELLDSKIKVICVSTQLIEAGVDIDFNMVIRSLSGLDSIVQAAGRCNRHGKMDRLGKVYVVNLNENLNNLKEISDGRKYASRVFREEGDNFKGQITSNMLNSYFEYYFNDKTVEKEMSYPIGTENMMSLLSDNLHKYSRYLNSTNEELLLRQSFKTANENFFVIGEKRAIIVQYDDRSKEIIRNLSSEYIDNSYKGLLREAQKYSINIFENVFKNMEIDRKVAPTKVEGVFYLCDGNYCETFGLNETAVMDLRCV